MGNLFFWIPATSIIRDGAMTFILMQFLPASVAILFVLLVRVWTIGSILMVTALAWLLLRRSPAQSVPGEYNVSQVSSSNSGDIS